MKKKNATKNMFVFSQLVSFRMIANEETHIDTINRNKKIGMRRKKHIDEEDEINILCHIKENIRFE